MNFIEQLEEEPLSEVVRYRSSAPKDAVAFSGTLTQASQRPREMHPFRRADGFRAGHSGIPKGRHQGGRGNAFPRRRDGQFSTRDAALDTPR